MTLVSPLAVGALPCYSHVNYVPYYSFQSYCVNTNLNLNLIHRHADDLKITRLNAVNSQYTSKQP